MLVVPLQSLQRLHAPATSTTAQAFGSATALGSRPIAAAALGA